MVCFTCQKCNECLKKSAVAKHAAFSRKCLPFWLTCIDCLKDFRGDEHLKHTSCVTEDVRYGAKGVQVKQQGVKQNMWMDSVTKVINAKHSEKSVLFVFNSLRDMTNVPKIRKKFHNFMKSKLGRKYDYNQSDVAFTMLETQFEKTKAEKVPQNGTNDKNVDETSNGNDKITKKEEKKKKKKHQNDELEENDERVGQDDENTDQLTKKELKKKNKLEILEEIPSEHSNEVEQSVENENLSKKELKKRKKQEKYLAELNEIENYQEDDNILEEPAKRNKKNKRKHDGSEEIPTDTKSKKRKVDKNKEDLPSENPNVEHAQPDSSTVEDLQTFKWDRIIIDILKHRSDNELSLKRLSKKVMAEYCERFGEEQNFEYLMKKFNKKIKSTKGVLVCKDKVMLKIDEI